jgi:hypothetical protein
MTKTKLRAPACYDLAREELRRVREEAARERVSVSRWIADAVRARLAPTIRVEPPDVDQVLALATATLRRVKAKVRR